MHVTVALTPLIAIETRIRAFGDEPVPSIRPTNGVPAPNCATSESNSEPSPCVDTACAAAEEGVIDVAVDRLVAFSRHGGAAADVRNGSLRRPLQILSAHSVTVIAAQG